MALQFLSTKLDQRTRVSLFAHQANRLDEIASINSSQVGALGVHFNHLVHIVAAENISSCIAHYLVPLGCRDLWA